MQLTTVDPFKDKGPAMIYASFAGALLIAQKIFHACNQESLTN